MAPLPFEVWIYDGRAAELLCRAPSLAEARARWSHSRHAAIFNEAGELVDTKRSADVSRLAAIEEARAGRAAPVKPARPLPRVVATEPMPARPSDPPPAPVEAPVAEPDALPHDVEPQPIVRRRAAATPTASFSSPAPASASCDEAPAPVVVVTRKPVPPTPEAPMPRTTIGRCPCGEESAPTGGPNGGGRQGTPEFADLCKRHRGRAATRRCAKGITAAEARAQVLATITGNVLATITGNATSKPAPSKRTSSKPTPAPAASTAPPSASDVLAVVRRQRAIVEALGGPDQAEAVVAAATRVGGPAALVQLVAEIAGAVS